MSAGYIFAVVTTDLLIGKPDNLSIFVRLAGVRSGARRGMLDEVWSCFVPISAPGQKQPLNILRSSNALTAAKQYHGQSAKQTEARRLNSAPLNAGDCLGPRSQSRGSGGYAPSVTPQYGSSLSSSVGSMRLIALAPARTRRTVVECAEIVTLTTNTEMELYLMPQHSSTPARVSRREIKTAVWNAAVKYDYTVITSTTINSMILTRT